MLEAFLNWIVKFFGKSEPPAGKDLPAGGSANVTATRENTESGGVDPMERERDQVKTQTKDTGKSAPHGSDGRGAPAAIEAVQQQPARSRRLEARPQKKQAVSVNVGVDFGTSSTKVFLRSLYHGKIYGCLFDDNPDGYPPVCVPSVVRIRNGRVYFGAEAERLAGGLALRSFKMCLRCQARGRVFPQCPNRDHACNKPGQLSLNSEADEPALADEVSAWFLAFVISEIRKRTSQLFADYEPSLTFQMAAPLGAVESELQRLVFERALYVAEKLSPVVSQGMPLDELRSCYQGIALAIHELPSEEERRTFVQPETHAAMIGYAASRVADAGLYAIVDIGAGTTDISFFRLSRDGDRLAYYSTDTVSLGADIVDQRIFDEHMAPAHPELRQYSRTDILGQIRVAKQRLHGRTVLAGQFELSEKALNASALSVGRGLFKEYQRVWRQAYQKEMRQSRWQGGYKLFLIGGGSELGQLVAPISASPCPQLLPAVELRSLALPESIVSEPSGDDDVIQSYTRLLMVAYGLSFHTAESPDYFTPKEVEPLPPPPTIERPSWDIGPFE